MENVKRFRKPFWFSQILPGRFLQEIIKATFLICSETRLLACLDIQEDLRCTIKKSTAEIGDLLKAMNDKAEVNASLREKVVSSPSIMITLGTGIKLNQT